MRPLAHDLVEQVLEAVIGLGDGGEEGAAGSGEDELVRAALEELDTQEPLELDHVAADGTLGDEEAVGGGGEAQVPADGFEGAEGVERQPASVQRHRPPLQPTRVRASISSSSA